MQVSNFIAPYQNGQVVFPAVEEGHYLGSEQGSGYWVKSYVPDDLVVCQVTTSTETILALKANADYLWIEDKLTCPECGSTSWGELNEDGTSPMCAECLAKQEVIDA